MERLTERSAIGNAFYSHCFGEKGCAGDGDRLQCSKCDFDIEICERLAAYEDTNLTPEQILEIDRLYADLAKHLDRVQKELELWHTSEPNESIKNEFAKMSTLVCHNCDHKDEYIEELESELAKYQQLEEDGLLLRLPCKLGDTLYIISRGEIIPLVVEYFTFSERGIRIYGMNERYFGNGTITLYPDKRIIEWFLTQEEAEQALKRLESEQK